MTLNDLEAWAQTQISHTAQPDIRPDIGISVLEMVDELEHLQAYVKELEQKLKALSKAAS